MPGYEKFALYPHDLAKAKQLIAEADPADREITVWTDNESPTTKRANTTKGPRRTRLSGES